MKKITSFSLTFAFLATPITMFILLALNPYFGAVLPILILMVFALSFVIGQVLYLCWELFSKEGGKINNIIPILVILGLLFVVSFYLYHRYEGNVNYWDKYGKPQNTSLK